MKRVAIPLLISLVIGLVANIALTCYLLTKWPRHRAPMSPSLLLQGAAVGSRDWPLTPPLAWPKPNSWGEWRAFGFRGLDVRHAEENQGRFAMAYVECGWPMPVVYRADMWWPWDDPQWASTADPDTPIAPIPFGWIANTLIFALAAWLLLFAAPATMRGYILHRRRSRRLCPHCAYPIGTSPVCTECGRAVELPPAPPVPAAAASQ